MSPPKAVLRSHSLRRAAVEACGPRALQRAHGSKAFGAMVTRDMAVHASPGLHQSIPPPWRGNARLGGLAAAAVVGSATLMLVCSYFDRVEELLPVEQGSSAAERIEEFYTPLGADALGRGQFGTVSLARAKATGEIVAVKRIARSDASEAHFREETEAHREVANHPNVVGLKGVFSDDECYYMVMEFAEGGELYDLLTMEGIFLDEDEVRCVLRETADALAYAHGRGIVHGDIKPENMLLKRPAYPRFTATTAAAVDHLPGAAAVSSDKGNGPGSRVGKVLLADFGSSFRLQGPDMAGRSVVKAYTAAYSAPEVVTNSSSVNEKADVWSMGVIAYVMCKGHHPFDPSSEATDEEIVERIINDEPDWDGIEPQAAHHIRRMLSRDPSDRPSALEVLQSSWLQSQRLA